MGSLKLSVLMSNYNHAQYIAETLNAIVSQSFKPFEVLVCDDGSTDNSVEIIQHFVDKYPFVHLIRNDINLGIFASFNKLIALAAGDYLYSASADDKILPGFFEKSMSLLFQYPQAGLCSALSFVTDKHGGNKKIFLTPIVSATPSFFPPDKVKKIFLRDGCWVFGVTTIMRLDYFREAGGYRPELYSFCDSFVYYILALKYGACFIPEPLTAWRRQESTYSATIAKNPEITKQWIGATKNLMFTTYKELFPSDFIEPWEKRQLIDYQLSRNLSLQNARLEDRSKVSQSFFSRGALSVLRILMKIQYFILKAYRYHQAGLPFEELFIQRLKNFWRSFSISIKSHAN